MFDQTLEEAFPDVDSGHVPFGSRILVQIRAAKEMTRGGIILADETRETIAANTQVCKVIAIGPMAFKSPNTGKDWPEGPWFRVGDYVRCPKFSGDRFEVPVPGTKGEVAMFATYDHLQFSCMVKNPLEVISFI
jgi:co-chaperonin GroES (HSP10)